MPLKLPALNLPVIASTSAAVGPSVQLTPTLSPMLKLSDLTENLTPGKAAFSMIRILWAAMVWPPSLRPVSLALAHVIKPGFSACRRCRAWAWA